MKIHTLLRLSKKTCAGPLLPEFRYAMTNPPPRKIPVYLSLDPDIFKGYFNPQDPAPLYKRQLSHEFEQYIMTCIRPATRDSRFVFRISYRNDQEKQFAEPLIFAIRRHFGEGKAVTVSTFEKFKLRTYKLLFLSLVVVMICQGAVPFILEKKEEGINSGLHNSMDVLCWVILWKPIDRLIFYWNPFLKDISILDRLANAETVLHEINDDSDEPAIKPDL